MSNDGKSIFVSDEYGPYLYQFDRATGERIRAFQIPANLAVTTPGPTTGTEGNPPNTTGRVANKGMEGLAITPDGKTLVGILQAPELQDKNGWLRIVTFDVASGQATHEYAYKLTTGSGVSDLVAINDHEFLVDERDGKGLGDGSAAVVKQFFKIDLTNDNDFVPTAAYADAGAPVAGPNQFFVVGIPFADLPGYLSQDIPVAPTLWLFGVGLMGLRRHARRASAQCSTGT